MSNPNKARGQTRKLCSCCGYVRWHIGSSLVCEECVEEEALTKAQGSGQ